MYRKSMREALEEARAYTAVHEVKVSKGGRTLDISKDDLPVYKAKGWELTENVFQKIRLSNSAVEYARKLSSYAVRRGGIDRKDFMKIADRMSNVKNDNDMKKIGKLVDDMDTEPRDLIKGSIALQMGPKTYETMFGDRLTSSDMNQYRQMTPRDMREETDLVEFKKMVVTIKDPIKRNQAMQDIQRFGKRTGFRIDKMGDEFRSFRIDGKGADLNKFATDMKNFYGAEIKAESVELEEGYEKAVLNALQKKGISGYFSKGTLFVDKGDEKAAKDAIDDEGSIFKAPKIIGEELQERFTIGDFKRLEADNRHDIAAKKLVDKFGTPEDKKEIDAINKRHNKTGYITGPDFKKRTQIVNKYFSKLMP